MKRGAIGPIGDDIPSIFPILAGVVLFISTMTFAYQQYDARNDYLSLRRSALAFSQYALQSGYLSDSALSANCRDYQDFASRRQVKLAVMVRKACDGLNIGLSEEIYGPSTRKCPADPQYKGSSISLSNLPKDSQMLSFPVAVDCPDGKSVGPGVAYVLVWRG